MTFNDITTEKALQDHYGENYDHCYGCGPNNADGLQLKSYWNGSEVTAKFIPSPKHNGISGFVYGGLVASLIDCHSMAAAAVYYVDSHPDLDSLPRFVTGSMTVRYIKPTPLNDSPIELTASVAEQQGRRSTVHIKVSCDGQLTAEGNVIAFHIPETMA